MRKLNRRLVFQLALPLSVAACGSEDETASLPADGTTKHKVELFSWWIAPGEAEALNALVALNRSAHPGVDVYNAAIISGPKAREVLDERLAAGEPPDLYQENAYNLVDLLAANPGRLQPLTNLFEELGLLDVVVPEVIADVTVDGEIYSMPVNIHRENAVMYNTQVFKDLQLELPKTLEELLAACATLKAAGVTPFATSHTGWIQRIFFNAVTAAVLGANAFESYYKRHTPLDEAGMSQAIDVFAEILDNYVNEEASDPSFGWTNATDLVLEGKAAMFVHGDWAKGYLTQIGAEPGEGFGVFGMPGAADLFLYGVDVFALCVGAKEPEAAKDFLRTVASKKGQAVFNTIKGSSPMRLDTDSNDLDLVGKSTLADLRDAKVRMRARVRTEWDMALASFANDRDKAALLQAFIDYPPID